MKVKSGDLMALTYWVKVKNVVGESLTVDELDHKIGNMGVHGQSLIDASYSADYIETEEKATMTDVAQRLVDSKNRPFTVCFVKADGEPRTLRGRLIKPEPLLGRSQVQDLDIKKGSNLRLVDHRTIKWLIVEGIKYTVK